MAARAERAVAAAALAALACVHDNVVAGVSPERDGGAQPEAGEPTRPPADARDSSCAGSVGTWRALSTVDAHPASYAMTGFSGRELVLATVHNGTRAISAYDVVADRWRRVPIGPADVDGRLNPYLGVVAGRLYVYGGRPDATGGSVLVDGITAPLAGGAWTALPKQDAPLLDPPPQVGSWVFERDGRALFVGHWGAGRRTDLAAAAVWDPQAARWSSVPRPSVYACGDRAPVASATGVACAGEGHLFLVTTTDVRELPSPPGGLSSDATLAWLDDARLFVWPGATVTPTGATARPLVLDVASGRWSPVAPGPSPRTSAIVAAVAGRVVVLGGLDPIAFQVRTDGAAYDPARDVWDAVACDGNPGVAFPLAASDGRSLYLYRASPPAFFSWTP
jgi:hypothetical protein